MWNFYLPYLHFHLSASDLKSCTGTLTGTGISISWWDFYAQIVYEIKLWHHILLLYGKLKLYFQLTAHSTSYKYINNFETTLPLFCRVTRSVCCYSECRAVMYLVFTCTVTVKLLILYYYHDLNDPIHTYWLPSRLPYLSVCSKQGVVMM